MNGTTTIVTEALRTVHNRIRMSTTAEAARLLEELRAAYQRLGREERQKIKSRYADVLEEQRRFTVVESASPGISTRRYMSYAESSDCSSVGVLKITCDVIAALNDLSDIKPVAARSKRKLRTGEHDDDTNSECFAYPLER